MARKTTTKGKAKSSPASRKRKKMSIKGVVKRVRSKIAAGKKAARKQARSGRG